MHELMMLIRVANTLSTENVQFFFRYHCCCSGRETEKERRKKCTDSGSVFFVFLYEQLIRIHRGWPMVAHEHIGMSGHIVASHIFRIGTPRVYIYLIPFIVFNITCTHEHIVRKHASITWIFFSFFLVKTIHFISAYFTCCMYSNKIHSFEIDRPFLGKNLFLFRTFQLLVAKQNIVLQVNINFWFKIWKITVFSLLKWRITYFQAKKSFHRKNKWSFLIFKKANGFQETERFLRSRVRKVESFFRYEKIFLGTIFPYETTTTIDQSIEI